MCNTTLQRRKNVLFLHCTKGVAVQEKKNLIHKDVERSLNHVIEAIKCFKIFNLHFSHFKLYIEYLLKYNRNNAASGDAIQNAFGD